MNSFYWNELLEKWVSFYFKLVVVETLSMTTKHLRWMTMLFPLLCMIIVHRSHHMSITTLLDKGTLQSCSSHNLISFFSKRFEVLYFKIVKTRNDQRGIKNCAWEWLKGKSGHTPCSRWYSYKNWATCSHLFRRSETKGIVLVKSLHTLGLQ